MRAYVYGYVEMDGRCRMWKILCVCCSAISNPHQEIGAFNALRTVEPVSHCAWRLRIGSRLTLQSLTVNHLMTPACDLAAGKRIRLLGNSVGLNLSAFQSLSIGGAPRVPARHRGSSLGLRTRIGRV